MNHYYKTLFKTKLSLIELCVSKNIQPLDLEIYISSIVPIHISYVINTLICIIVFCSCKS